MPSTLDLELTDLNEGWEIVSPQANTSSNTARQEDKEAIIREKKRHAREAREAAEKAETDRKAREQLEAERIEQEKAAKALEVAHREEAQRLERELLEAKAALRRKEAERIELEKAVKAAEAAHKEELRLAHEKLRLQTKIHAEKTLSEAYQNQKPIVKNGTVFFLTKQPDKKIIPRPVAYIDEKTQQVLLTAKGRLLKNLGIFSLSQAESLINENRQSQTLRKRFT